MTCSIGVSSDTGTGTKTHVIFNNAYACVCFSLVFCRMDRHIIVNVIITQVYGQLFVSVKGKHHINNLFPGELAIDSDDEADVSVPPTTTKAEAFASISVV